MRMMMMVKPVVVARLGAGVAGEDPGTVIIMIRMRMRMAVVRPIMVARLGAGVVEGESGTGIIMMRMRMMKVGDRHNRDEDGDDDSRGPA